MSKRVHVPTVAAPSGASNPRTVAGTTNPWERLAARKAMPSVFAQDPTFTQAKPAASSNRNALDLGVLSKAGKKSRLHRVAPRKNNPVIAPRRSPDEIPKALRSSISP